MKRFEATKSLIETHKKKTNEKKRFQNLDKESTRFRANANYQELQHIDFENFERNAKKCETKRN